MVWINGFGLDRRTGLDGKSCRNSMGGRRGDYIDVWEGWMVRRGCRMEWGGGIIKETNGDYLYISVKNLVLLFI